MGAGRRSASFPLSGAIDAAVVGAGGVGAIHARELAAHGCHPLRVAGRTAESSSAIAAKLSGQLGCVIEPLADLSDLVRQPSEFISICSPTELHAEHCRLLLPTGAFLFVEKPFFWNEPATRSSVTKEAASLFDLAHGRMLVNHPTGLLARAFIDASRFPDPLRDFTFSYRTRGRYRGRSIAVDLLPHAFSALLAFKKDMETPFDDLRDIDVRVDDTAFNATFALGETRCSFDFSQDPAQSGSEVFFCVNGMTVRRYQEQSSAGFQVFLDFDNRRVEIPNPMNGTIRRALISARAGQAPSDHAAYVTRIMTLMASLLLD